MNKIERETVFLSDPAIIDLLKDKLNEFYDKTNEFEKEISRLQEVKATLTDQQQIEWADAFIHAVQVVDIEPLVSEIKRFNYLIQRSRDEQNRSSGWVDNTPSKAVDLNQLKQQVRIEDLIGSPKRRSGGRSYYNCPIHQENTPSFVVDENKNTWTCYGACASGGSVIDLYMKLHNVDFKTAIKELSN